MRNLGLILEASDSLLLNTLRFCCDFSLDSLGNMLNHLTRSMLDPLIGFIFIFIFIFPLVPWLVIFQLY